jgi:hypothetical protein
MRTVFPISVNVILKLALAATPAVAEPLADHPAIAARRVIAAQGYDHASKFYPHPAGLALRAEAPRTLHDHPAVLVFKREQEQQALALEAARRLLAQAR